MFRRGQSGQAPEVVGSRPAAAPNPCCALYRILLSFMIIIMERPAEGISAALKRRRQDLGLSLSRLARRVGTSPATIFRYENGWHRFELYTLQKLASALGCSLTVGLAPLRFESAKPGKEAAIGRLRRLFWDKPLAAADLREHKHWVVRRVLEFGGLSDVRDLEGLLGRNELLRLAACLRFSSERTSRFWTAILAQEGVKCRRKSSPRAARISWLR